MYLFGQVSGYYQYDSTVPEFWHARKVEWRCLISKSELSLDSLNSLRRGALFKPRTSTVDEISQLIAGGSVIAVK
jgi:predicted Mrr-cat superfamily restriction endonuclease